jgi:hypothetical protein
MSSLSIILGFCVGMELIYAISIRGHKNLVSMLTGLLILIKGHNHDR